MRKGTLAAAAGFRQRDVPAVMRALVIDDDRSVCMAIKTILAPQGFQTVLAPDAHAGIQAFESSEFDVVIVDIFMSGINGLETIAVLRRRAPRVPIVAMSGFRFRDTMGPGLDFLGMAAKLGANYCLRKPFAPQELLAAINSRLDAAFLRNPSPGNPEPRHGPMR
jgi:DNA-binding response OmpR family regulator